MAFACGAFDFGQISFEGNVGLLDGIVLDFDGNFGKN